MDTLDIFRQLTHGARFNTKRKNTGIKKTTKTEQYNDDEIVADADNRVDKAEDTAPTTRNECDNSDAEDDVLMEFEFIKGGKSDKTTKARKRQRTKLTPKEMEKQIELELIAALRKDNQITVLGKNIPSPVGTFEDLQKQYKLSAQLLKNVGACNYPRPTAIQMQAMPIMLQGRSLMACAPTGSGKTIAFLLPIINDLRSPQKVGIRAIVLAPTRELAQQTYRECIRLSEKTALKINFISKVAQEKAGTVSAHKFDILISTPNRVRFMLQQQPPLLDLKSVEWFVIDEADRLMEEGQNNFKEQLDDILAACTNSTKKLALFSATYTVPVAKWALRNVKNLVRVRIGQQNSAAEAVNQELLFVGAESGKLLAIRDLVRTGLKPPVLIFVQSKDRAKQLFTELLYDGINVDVIHADRTQQQRDNCVRAFRQGKIWVLICTELMGRGIDFKGVNLVINYDFPPTVISYIHRIGRTGRAGRVGKAITFFTQDDTPNLRSIAHIITNAGGKVPDYLLKMKKQRKTLKKKLSNYAPKRDDISTKIKPETNLTEKLKSDDKVVSNQKTRGDNHLKTKQNEHKRQKIDNGLPNKVDKRNKSKKSQQAAKGPNKKGQVKKPIT